jgi:hypothetical protein
MLRNLGYAWKYWPTSSKMKLCGTPFFIRRWKTFLTSQQCMYVRVYVYLRSGLCPLTYSRTLPENRSYYVSLAGGPPTVLHHLSNVQKMSPGPKQIESSFDLPYNIC